MKYLPIVITVALFACSNKKNIPNVNDIKIEITTQRFDKTFFSIDTNAIEQGLDKLSQTNQSFVSDYLYNILGILPNADSAKKYAKLFLTDKLYRQVQQDVAKTFPNFSVQEKEIKQAFQFVKYYFPNYQLPKNIITFIGPIDGVGTALTSNHDLAIGLQGFLGKDYPAYQAAYIQQVYPNYKTARFSKEYIPVEVVKNLLTEIYPAKQTTQPLIEQMIEVGKRIYTIDAILPYAADSIKIGYTHNQLKECENNEKLIWAFFVERNLLFSKDPEIISPYLTDGPKTPELSETAPGNIGAFVGWKIVKQWMKQNKQTSLQVLFDKPANQIFNEVGYKP
jgi:DNA-directed RNA polymerase subunit F